MKLKALFAIILLGFASLIPAGAADIGTQVKDKFSKAASSCTTTSCSGPYIGFNVMGIGTNADVIGSGINGSVFGGGQNIGGQVGYQFWNGTYFLAVEAFGDYTINGDQTVGGGSKNRYLFGQIVKLGGALSGLLGGAGTSGTTPSQSPVPIAVPSALANSLMAPFIQMGAVERSWGTGWATGAGATFVIASGWNAEVGYLYANYGSANASPVATVKSENLIQIKFNRMF